MRSTCAPPVGFKAEAGEAAGSGRSAALAAAFKTPIAAVLFSHEEIVGDMNAPILGSVVLSSEVMRTLAKAGADPKLTTQDGTTVLMAAAGSGAEINEVIQFLEDKGAKLDVKDSRGRTPLHYRTPHDRCDSRSAEEPDCGEKRRG